tara:strand:- start:1562 stop:1900 length:339 start_codon:yes stop_codon:yes gene_type:complete
MQKKVMSFDDVVALHTRSHDNKKLVNKKPKKCHFSQSVSFDDMVSLHTRSHDSDKMDILKPIKSNFHMNLRNNRETMRKIELLSFLDRDFDEASYEWTKNKKRKGNGMYEYC